MSKPEEPGERNFRAAYERWFWRRFVPWEAHDVWIFVAAFSSISAVVPLIVILVRH
jgi:hypothetical protein